MKHVRLLINLLWIILIYWPVHGLSQCGPGVPSYTVNLTGHPDTLWTSPSIGRNGNCCGTVSPDVCIHFYLTLDTGAAGIIFNVTGGTGATYYNINCSTSARVGAPVCISGSGSWNIDYCKPGGNPQVYTFRSIPKPNLKRKKVFITSLCNPMLIVENLVKSSITWKSLSGSQYNANLSCTTACDTTYVTMGSTFPSYVDYQVCGASILPCYSGGTYCDTVRVTKINPVAVSISPDPAIACYGSSVTLTANVSGGISPYFYRWSTGASTKTINAVPGTYWVRVSDSINCSQSIDTILVSMMNQIKAEGGNDTAVCSDISTISLKGSVKTATGGIWTGGSGTFLPGNTALNASYTPTSSEKSAGVVKLYLTTTGNGNCSAVKDSVKIQFYSLPSASVIADTAICAGSSISIGSAAIPGNLYSWISIPAGFISLSSNPSVSPTTSTTYILTETNGKGCKKSDSVKVIVKPLPAPSVNGYPDPCEFTSSVYYTPNTGNKYSWSVTGGNIMSGQNTNAITIRWGTAGSGQIVVTETNPVTGCKKTAVYPVNIYGRPIGISIFH